MALKLLELLSLALLIWVSGMYWGPWLALTRSMHAFAPEVYIPIVRRLGANIGPLMTVLTPAALASTLPVLALSYGGHPVVFGLTLACLGLFALTLAVTVLIEVPIALKAAAWTPETLPGDWEALRDRWGAFHLLRVVPSVVGLALLLVAAVFYS